MLKNLNMKKINMKNILTQIYNNFLCQIIIIFISFNITSYSSQAAFIIRDSESEDLLLEILSPIQQSAKLESVNIFLVKDSSANAFVIDDNSIYINTGLIINFPDIDIIRGVLAHELGHIAYNHFAKSNISSSEFELSIPAIAVGALTAAFGNINPLIFATMMQSEVNLRNKFRYSRIYENAADIFALKHLEKSGYTAKGMLDFFNKLKGAESFFNGEISEYSTHPLSKNRFDLVDSFYQNSKFLESQNPPEMQDRLNLVVAKLKAYTDKNPGNILKKCKNKKDLPSKYAQAICHFRLGNKNKALGLVEQLTNSDKNNPYFLELKGDITLNFGSAKALEYYEEALKIKPDDLLLKLSHAVGILTISSPGSEQLSLAKEYLSLILNNDPNNLYVLRLLAIYYEKSGKNAKSLLTLAKIAQAAGQYIQAKMLAKAALEGLREDSVKWYQAQDIIVLAEKALDNPHLFN